MIMITIMIRRGLPFALLSHGLLHRESERMGAKIAVGRRAEGKISKAVGSAGRARPTFNRARRVGTRHPRASGALSNRVKWDRAILGDKSKSHFAAVMAWFSHESDTHSTLHIVLSKEIRNALNLRPGQALEVHLSAGAVFLSPVPAGKGRIVRKGKLKVYSGKIPDLDVEEAVKRARHYTQL